MKITFKDLKQQKFELEFDESQLISEIKLKLEEEKGWDRKDQKLIYSGKILKDDQTLGSYQIEEKGYVVCMVTKPKVIKSGSASIEPSTPVVAGTPVIPQAPVNIAATVSAAPHSPSTPTPQRTAPPPSAGLTDPSSLSVGTDRAEAIANMEAMGFDRAQIELAMRAAFFNPERAVEYLLTGIPENLQTDHGHRRSTPAAPVPSARPDPVANVTTSASNEDGAGEAEEADVGNVNLFDLAAQQRAGASGGGATATANAAGTEPEAGSLDFLRDHERFQQLRQVVQQNPQMLEHLVQQIGSGNPDLARLIAQNQDQFLRILSEHAEDDVPPPPGSMVVSVTEEERDAIERLCRLGFSRDEAMQAYFACDKNEEMAANFLFDQPDEEGHPPPQA